MIIKAASHTIKNILIFFLFILLVFLALVGALKYGIQIDNITLPKVKVSQLYIKLDKKIIVEIENLTFDMDTKADTSFEEVNEAIKLFPYLNQFFSDINIQKIHYHNEEFRLLYKENIFNLESLHLSTKLKIIPVEKLKINIEIYEAYLKDYKLNINGKANIDFKNKKYDFNGEFDTFGIKGKSIINVEHALLKYYLQTEHFTNVELSNLMNFISPLAELEPLVKVWIHENIVAKDYKLHFLEGKFNLENFDYYPLEIKGSATANDVIVAFEPTVPPAHADKVGITLKNDQLIFDLTAPSYQEKIIQRADVSIYNLLAKGTGIIVDLDAISKFDVDIHKILHAFKIIVPITQTSGETNATVRLDIKFLPFDINATGTFTVAKSNFLLNGLPMFSQSGQIRLDNYLVYLDKTNIRYKSLFDITTTGLFDTKKETYNGISDINALTLDFSGARLLEIKNLKNQNGTMQIDANATYITIPKLTADIKFAKNNNQFIIQDIAMLAPFSPFMQENSLKNGSVTVSTKNFEKYSANLDLQDLTIPLLEAGNLPLSHLIAKLSTDTKTLDARSLDDKIALHFDKNINININDLNISMPKGEESFYTPVKISIEGKNSSFIDVDSNQTILSDSYTLILDKDMMNLISHKGSSTFHYQKNNKSLKIKGNNLDDNFSNNLLNKHYFEKGDFILDINGTHTKEYQGSFSIHETYIKDLKLFDNLMATLNAIPSLIVFSDPKFNQLGYFVKNGTIEFSRSGEVITIKNMQLTGNNADIVGNGTINFTSNKIDMKLKIKTLKTFSNVIGFVPIVGGVILGEDRRFSTNVTVNGEIENPNIETNLIMDAIKSPFNIIKRTLEIPLDILKN